MQVNNIEIKRNGTTIEISSTAGAKGDTGATGAKGALVQLVRKVILVIKVDKGGSITGEVLITATVPTPSLLLI